MDTVKIGRFLSELRKEKNMTQEQLGETLGVTNKTVSRWETGVYLPPVEMLQAMSGLYGVTINEILCGERLGDDSYKSKAEENLTKALENSAFTVKEKQEYFRKKWRKDHCFEMVIEMAVLIACAVLAAIYYKEVCIALSVVCLVWAFWNNNRMDAYVEKHIYEEKREESPSDGEKDG